MIESYILLGSIVTGYVLGVVETNQGRATSEDTLYAMGCGLLWPLWLWRQFMRRQEDI